MSRAKVVAEHDSNGHHAEVRRYKHGGGYIYEAECSCGWEELADVVMSEVSHRALVHVTLKSEPPRTTTPVDQPESATTIRETQMTTQSRTPWKTDHNKELLKHADQLRELADWLESAVHGIDGHTLDVEALEVVNGIETILPALKSSAVVIARTAGRSWGTIGQALGVTKQAAAQKYGGAK